MQKTLFKKYLRVTLAIILISFFLLGLVMLVFIKSYWQDEKQDLLRRNAESIAGIAAASATPVQGDNYILLDTERMQSFMNAFSENMDADSKGKSDFSQENNAFTEDCDTEQEEHQQKDDYHRRDTYHQSQKKGKYHRREYQNRERTKQ